MAIYGVNTERTIKNILIRKEELLKGIKNSKNGIKSALIVQGGSMRGVFSAGSLIALEKLGFTQRFDAVYASSGGAVNASYFLSGQSPFGTSIYYENINNSKFINLLRVKKIVDIDYFFDEVITRIKSLDAKKVASTKTDFYFFVTDMETGKYKKITHKSKNFWKLLKASCAMPVYYNKTISLNGNEYVDGSISNAIPIEDAINDSCTDVIVLLTYPVRLRDSIGAFENFFLKLSMPRLRNFVSTYSRNFNNSFDFVIGRHKTEKNVNIATIIPDDDFQLHRLTKNENLLKEAAIDGARQVFELFNEDYDMNGILRYG